MWHFAFSLRKNFSRVNNTQADGWRNVKRTPYSRNLFPAFSWPEISCRASFLTVAAWRKSCGPPSDRIKAPILRGAAKTSSPHNSNFFKRGWEKKWHSNKIHKTSLSLQLGNNIKEAGGWNGWLRWQNGLSVVLTTKTERLVGITSVKYVDDASQFANEFFTLTS